jgi:hypothetical protein
VLASPSLEELGKVCAEFRPEIVHLTGFDNHQGLARLAESGGADTRVAVRDEQRPAADWLRDDKGVVDGYLLSRPDGMPVMSSPQALAHALTAGGSLRPLFVGLNLWNSAARIAPQLLPAGVVASMGFQDAFDESLAEYFFETFYSRLAVGRWIVPDAFEQAWAATRLQVDLVPGTGIALWARTPLIDPQATHRLRAVGPGIRCRDDGGGKRHGRATSGADLRLLPVDQWRDNRRDGRWLPSFVQPRDPAITGALAMAQRYNRVLRDDPSAGFEGYQLADPADEDSLRGVDRQVEAIWATLLHDWRWATSTRRPPTAARWTRSACACRPPCCSTAPAPASTWRCCSRPAWN